MIDDILDCSENIFKSLICGEIVEDLNAKNKDTQWRKRFYDRKRVSQIRMLVNVIEERKIAIGIRENEGEEFRCGNIENLSIVHNVLDLDYEEKKCDDYESDQCTVEEFQYNWDCKNILYFPKKLWLLLFSII